MKKTKFKKNEISKISKKLTSKILKMKNKKARVVAFSGDLGAGKTTLTQELAREFGIKDTVISPTFVIMKAYDIHPSSLYYEHFKRLVHIDAYRLDSHLELFKIGWTEIQNDKDNLIIIEWPEKVKKCLENDALWVKLDHIDDETRGLKY
ncbi:MAG: tRNA (adenosine(37)-N6)-threonylcarbamoyltransferase complex ATPase subunit type 1 TsaE [Candidatus Paceibacterota bacterium]|jgi:tRNA threonylcarbamoyladenosine biosynthesis protein TsaE